MMNSVLFWIFNLLICAAIVIAVAVVVMGAVALVGYCRHRISLRENEEYVAVKRYKDPEDDFNENLIRSAELHSYQEAKANIIAQEKAKRRRGMGADFTDESEQGSDEEGEIFVYELPGMAAPDDMNVPNPLFDDIDSTSFEEESERRSGRSSSQSYSSRGSQRSYRCSPEVQEEHHGM